VVKLFDKQPKGLDFQESSFLLPIEHATQVFIGDLNGDFLEDILFSEVLTPHKLMLAL
jgi:hypothetical protein